QLARQEGYQAGVDFGWKQGRANALEEAETERSVAAAQPIPLPVPRASGVSRVADNQYAILVSYRERISDDELRNPHEVLAHRAAPAGDARDTECAPFSMGVRCV